MRPFNLKQFSKSRKKASFPSRLDFCRARETLLLVFVQDVRTSLLCDFDLVDDVFHQESASTNNSAAASASNAEPPPSNDVAKRPDNAAASDIQKAAVAAAVTSAAGTSVSGTAAPATESKEMPTAPSTPQLVPAIHDTTFFVPHKKVRKNMLTPVIIIVNTFH